MRYSIRLVEHFTCLIALSLAVHASLWLQHTALAQSTDKDGPRTEPAPQKPGNDTSPQVDPLIASVVVKTYDRLGVTSFRSETLFRDGQLIGNWDGCRADHVQFKDCKVIPAYRDRMSIEYTFDRNRLDEYTLHEPSIEARTSGASAQLDDFSFRGDLRFTIFFRCSKQLTGTSTEVFDLTIPILKDFAIKMRFAKNCTSGVHPYVRLGTISGGIPRLLPLPLEQMYASPTAVTTDFFIRVSLPARSQVHGPPVLNSSNEGIRVSLRGIAEEETMVAGKDLRFSVVYECDVNDEAEVKLAVPLPPWEDLSIGISKKCGGRVPEMVSIGTALDANDIVENGTVSPRFTVPTGDGHEEELFEVGQETNSIKLYLRNAKSVHDEVVHLGKIHFTVNDSEIVRVTGTKYGGTAISAMGPGECVTEEVKFVCRKKGSATVIISIPILQYEVVEFRLEKQCRDAISYVESGIESWWTVGGIEDVAFVVVALLLIGWCIRVRGRENKDRRSVFGTRGYHRVAGNDGH